MKIERVDIGAFGRLVDFDSGPEDLADLVVVLGPNEADKSTLFHFLSTMLYGFHPASREGNPYSPWNGADASGCVRIRLDGGGCAEVTRELKSQPSASLRSEGVTTDLRNRALPWVEHVPRTVFGQVFAVTLRELVGLDAETWAGIQDRLMGSMGASDLEPARAVADALEHEAGQLWRPHRRGNQRVRDIQEEIRTLRAQRRNALDRDRDLRGIVEQLTATRAELDSAREERALRSVTLERVQDLAPIRAQLTRIEDLRLEGGDRTRLSGLPDAPRDALTRLDERLAGQAARLADLTARAESARGALARFDDRARGLVDHAAAIRAVASRVRNDGSRDASRLHEEIAELERRLDERAGTTLAIGWRELPRGALLALPLTELRAEARRAEQARDDRKIQEAAASGSHTVPSLVPAGVIGAVGILVTVVGLVFGPTLLTTAGIAALAVALTLVVVLWSPRARRDGSGAGVEEARAREREALEQVRALLRDIPVKPTELEVASARLAEDIELLQAALREHGRRSAEIRELEEAGARIEAEIAELSTRLGMDSGMGVTPVDALEHELRAAERAEEAASGAQNELDRTEGEIARLSSEQDALEAERAALAERLRALGSGDLETGISAAEAALSAHERADQLEDELVRAYGDVDALRVRIEEAEALEAAWTASDQDLAKLRAEVERLNDLIVDLASRAEALERDVAHMSEQETVDSVDGEIEALSVEERRLKRERDRRWILAQLIREADRRFREEHQPDVIRRAGGYLKHLTDGRYDKVIVDETGSDEIFHLTGPGLSAPVPLTPPVSTGTLEQAYLSLRLAIIDHLDQGGERLPIFIDEAFVNWDDVRRDRGLEVLEAIARGRQVFLFTCHPETAEPLRRAGARVLEVER